MKKIMILGGGYYQMPLIIAANECGYQTIVCGIAGNFPGYKHASKWYDVDTFDREACLKIAKQENIDGILTTGTDQMLPTLGYIVDQMHLYGCGLNSTVLASNKLEMKEAFMHEGVRTASFIKATSVDDCLSFADTKGYPVVLKIVDGSGSRGIAIVHNAFELKEQYPLIVRETKKDYIIIEQFVNGLEFGAQAYVQGGKLTFVMPHGDITFHGVTDVPVGHYAPFEKHDDVFADVTEQLNRCISALKLNNTALNADFILSDDKVYVLEIGARAGATCLPELVSCYYGIDYYKYLVKMCVGERIQFADKPVACAWVETLTTQKNGIVAKIQLPQLTKEVVDFQLYPKIGDKVSPFRTAYDRIGILVMKGDTMKSLIEKRNVIINDINIELC